MATFASKALLTALATVIKNDIIVPTQFAFVHKNPF